MSLSTEGLTNFPSGTKIWIINQKIPTGWKALEKKNELTLIEKI